MAMVVAPQTSFSREEKISFSREERSDLSQGREAICGTKMRFLGCQRQEITQSPKERNNENFPINVGICRFSDRFRSGSRQRDHAGRRNWANR
jgi:hypothetical protein